MGLAAVSKGSVSCRAGQCARCAPASRLGTPALPERGSALAPRGRAGASCPGRPRGEPWGSAKAPPGAAQAPRGACGVCERCWGRVGGILASHRAGSGGRGTARAGVAGARGCPTPANGNAGVPACTPQPRWRSKPHGAKGFAGQVPAPPVPPPASVPGMGCRGDRWRRLGVGEPRAAPAAALPGRAVCAAPRSVE